MTAIQLFSRRHASVAAATAVVALSLTACGATTGGTDTDTDADAPPTTTTATAQQSEAAPESPDAGQTEDTAATAATAETATVTETGVPPDETVVSMLNGGAATDPSQAPAEGGRQLVVTDVRVGDHEGFDRVVLEFAGDGNPGWYASFTDEPRQQGSGQPIDYPGDTALTVMAVGVGLPFDTGAEAMPVGPVAGVSPAGDIAGVAHHGIFEGQAQFVIGLNGEPRPYTVNILQEPTRMVIDVSDR